MTRVGIAVRLGQSDLERITVPSMEKLTTLATLIDDYAAGNGLHQSSINELLVFRESQPHGRIPFLYEPGIIIAAQGTKYIYLDGHRYDYRAGEVMALFLPMVVECEVKQACETAPLLGLAIRIDRHRLAKLLLRIDSASAAANAKPEAIKPSGIFMAPLAHSLLDSCIRLMQVLHDPLEAEILGESIIDEIYFRLLNDKQGQALRTLLCQQGQIQQIAKAVEYLHEHLHQAVCVDEMASLVNMSRSGFHKKFREVMHQSPLQYVKLVRLNKAKTYLIEGKSVSEAGYMAGYNSPAQFSREYKREFGIAPSTLTNK